MIQVDLHAHTSASHGKHTAAEMVQAAAKCGLRIFGLSEHSPRPAAYSYPVEYREHLIASFDGYVRDVQALKKQYTTPKILLGMELDWFPAERAFMEQSVAAYPFDYLVGGIHFLGSLGFDFTQDDWKISPQQCAVRYETYFLALKDMAQSGLVNIAAHPDIIKLFSVETFHDWLTLPQSQTLITEALKAIRDAGMAMEISSAGLRKPCKEIYPCPEIMRIAAEQGVSISFGSDAHCVNTPAYAFDQLADYARSYGYTHSVFFEGGVRHDLAF